MWRATMLVGAAMMALCGPARAFDFHPRDFAVMFDEEAERQGRPSRIHMLSCDPRAPYDCTYQGADSTLIEVFGSSWSGHSRTVAMLLSTGTSGDKTLFQDAPFILAAIVSPKSSVDERKALIGQIFPSSIAEGMAAPKFAMLGATKYTAGVLPHLILALGAIDTSE